MKFTSIFLVFAHTLFATTPQAALNRLKEGNQHYVSDALQNPDRSVARRDELRLKQQPFAVIVGCSDSRVPPEIIFDQGVGSLFVVRVAGQVAGPVELGSIDYAVKYLGARLVLVLGHESCGAVTAVVEGNTKDIEDVANLIKPALNKSNTKTIESAVKANIRWVVAYLKKTSLINQLIGEGKVDVVGGYYHLSDGHVEFLD